MDTTNKNGTCYIVGASDTKLPVIEPAVFDFIIAADGGYDKLLKIGIEPNLILGDFDSSANIPDAENVMIYPQKKNETDTFIAVSEGFMRGYRRFVLHCCFGGRADHSVANIQTLDYISEHGGVGYISNSDAVLTVIRNGELNMSPCDNGYISVFAIDGKASGVSIEGLEYTLDNAILTPSIPIGTSNCFIGKKSKISVKNGALLVVIPNPSDLSFSDAVNPEVWFKL